VLAALDIARSGMSAATARLEATAVSIASDGTAAASTQTISAAPGVRVRYLPLPQNAASQDPAEEAVSMAEDEMSFKLNAVVFKTAAEMIRSDEPVDQLRHLHRGEVYFTHGFSTPALMGPILPTRTRSSQLLPIR